MSCHATVLQVHCAIIFRAEFLLLKSGYPDPKNTFFHGLSFFFNEDPPKFSWSLSEIKVGNLPPPTPDLTRQKHDLVRGVTASHGEEGVRLYGLKVPGPASHVTRDHTYGSSGSLVCSLYWRYQALCSGAVSGSLP